jgi:FMN phosphatase YigB (HAD superfamily)
MAGIDVVSFDMEGTLIDNRFSDLIWETDIPALYGCHHGLDLDMARERVLGEYREIGEDRPEWYDLGYWFRRLRLPGDWRELPPMRLNDCFVYPETAEVLENLSQDYTLVISSNTIREFLEVQLTKLPRVFTEVFSAPSDFKTVKKTDLFYREICRILDIEPSSVAHVGDSLKFDYQAPRALGIEAFHLVRSHEVTGEHVVRDLMAFDEKVRRLAFRI